MLLTTLFWICSCFPGYALARRMCPSVHEAGLLAVLAFSLLGTFLILSPVSLACYALGAPLWVFSSFAVVAAAGGLTLSIRARADRELLACVRREPLAGWILLAALLWLQARIGAYFSGDATFHVGRMRVLLEHGFTNRDIYLADYYFQHIYHSNLLYPVYASLSQLTAQTYLEAWFYSQVWAKLWVAAGHYVLGHAVTRRPLAGWLLALTVITANAGETYTTYPNTIAVGWLVPTMLGAGYALLAGEARVRQAAVVAACSFVIGQVHGLYAVYAGFVLAPVFALALLWPKQGNRRWVIALGLAGTLAAAPFLLVSQFGFRQAVATPDEPAASSDGDAAAEQPSVAPPPAPAPAPVVKRRFPDVMKGRPAVPTPAVAAGGGHLEKWLELDERTGELWFEPENIGGWRFIALGFAGLALAFALNRERRRPLVAAGLGTVLLSVSLFFPPLCTLAIQYLKQPFVIARLSTVLSSLLLLGACAGAAELTERLYSLSRLTKLRWLPEVLSLVLATFAATRLTGHAPLFFSEVVERALAPREVRYATLDRLETRRELLAKVIPPGTTILTTARFARSVVMICDCYVIIADRGHTRVPFSHDRRNALLSLNGPKTPWPARAALMRRFDLELVVFESRHLRRLYRWTEKYGRVIGEAAGLRVVEIHPDALKE